jgi:hypothetical protein
MSEFRREVSEMPVTVKHITLWRAEVENKPGVLARTLEALAAAGADLHIVMGYRYPRGEDKAAIEVYPVTTKKSVAAAQAAGLGTSSIPSLLVEGDNKPGLAHAVAKALGDAGINVGFLVAQVVGRRYSAVVGFENEVDANTAAALIKKATAARKK